MKKNKSENKELVRALKFYEKTLDGDYCELEINRVKNLRIEIPVIDSDEELYYYSITN